MVKYCTSCGNALPDEAVFCSVCGNRQFVVKGKVAKPMPNAKGVAPAIEKKVKRIAPKSLGVIILIAVLLAAGVFGLYNGSTGLMRPLTPITNGNFETGDLTGWTATGPWTKTISTTEVPYAKNNNYTGYIHIKSGYAGCDWQDVVGNSENIAKVYQTITLPNIKPLYMHFWLKEEGAYWGDGAQVFIDDGTMNWTPQNKVCGISWLKSFAGAGVDYDWTEYYVNISEYAGKTVDFGFAGYNSNGYADHYDWIYFDDVYLTDKAGGAPFSKTVIDLASLVYSISGAAAIAAAAVLLFKRKKWLKIVTATKAVRAGASTKKIIVLVAVVAVVAVVGGLYFSGFIPGLFLKDCGSDMSCFQAAAKTCTAAKVLTGMNVTNPYSIYAEVRGGTPIACTYYMKIKDISPSLTGISGIEPILNLKGKDMTCTGAYEKINTETDCRGPLMDAITAMGGTMPTIEQWATESI